jgi:hypothetical protein
MKDNFDEEYKKMSAIMEIIKQDNRDVYEVINEITYPLLFLQSGFEKIRVFLETLTEWSSQGGNEIFRYGWLLENELKFAQKKIDERATQEHLTVHNLVLENTYSTLVDQTPINVIDVYEDVCENFQMIYSYAMNQAKEFILNKQTVTSPYRDRKMARLHGVASLWRIYSHLWHSIIFKSWGFDKEDPSQIFFQPISDRELIASKIAEVRYQELQFEFAQIKYMDSRLNNYNQIYEQLLESIELPKPMTLWNLECDIKALADCIPFSYETLFSMLDIQKHHFENILDQIRILPDSTDLYWKDYIKALLLVRILSKTIQDKTQTNFESDLPCIQLIRKNRLAECICFALGVDINTASKLIDTITYDHKYKNIEIWDTPLLKYSDDILLLVPAIILMGSPGRAIENFLSEWNPHLFSARGHLLENKILEIFQQNSIPSQCRVNFHIPDNDIECDLVVFWNNILLIFEIKSTKAIFTPQDFFRAKNVIKKAEKQLTIRKQLIQENWISFRKATQKLNLPLDALPSENIKLIGVSNLLEFAGIKEGEIIFTDEYCIERFFDDPNIDLQIFEAKKLVHTETIGKIRHSETPTPLEFWSYLSVPPQIKMIEDAIEIKSVEIPHPEEALSKAFIRTAIYDPNKMIINVRSKKVMKTLSKKQRKRHKTNKS